MAKVPAILVGIDLGNHSWKAVRLERKGNGYALTQVGMVPSPLFSKTQETLTEQIISSQLKALGSQVKMNGAVVCFTINSLNTTVRYVELPQMPLGDIRNALKLNSATLLRQNFENYTFDACAVDPSQQIGKNSKSKKGAANSPGKIKMIVGGISVPETMQYFHGARRAGIKPHSLQLAAVSIINAFEATHPDEFRNGSVVLLDLGFLSSNLTILDRGQPLLTRAVTTGSKQFTEYIAQITGLDFSKAEATKLTGDPVLGEAVTRTAVTLIREIRSSINFYEKNSEYPISKVYLTGATLISPAVLEALAKDIGTPCECWNGAKGLDMALSGTHQSLFTQNQMAFCAALGSVRSLIAATESKTPTLSPAAPVAASDENPA